MVEPLREYNFKKNPKEISYSDETPFKLDQDLIFYHNKNIFRKHLVELQNLFKSYTKNPLIASGIRDTYLDEVYFENYLLVLFMGGELIEKCNDIVKQHSARDIDPKCYYLITTSEYMLLLSKDTDGLLSGIRVMEELFTQTFEDYFKQEKFEEFIKIRQFKIYDC